MNRLDKPMVRGFGGEGIHGAIFPCKAGALIQNAEAKKLYHDGRVEFWSGKMEEFKKEFMEVGPIQGNPYESSYSNAIQLQNNQASLIQQNLQQAQRKIEEHREQSRLATSFARAFTLYPDQEIYLSINDIAYFRL